MDSIQYVVTFTVKNLLYKQGIASYVKHVSEYKRI